MHDGELSPSTVQRDELIGDVIEVVADDLRLGAYAEEVVAGTLDQRGRPACRDGSEGVPSMAGDETEPGGLDRKLSLDIAISLARRLVMLHAVRTEASLEEIDDAAMFKLAGLNLQQIVREREEPETGVA